MKTHHLAQIRIARRFGVEVQEIERIKSGVYRLVSTDNHVHCLKRMRYSRARIRWMDATMKQLRQQGFTAIAWRDPASSVGKRLLVKPRGGFPYILTPWLSGREPHPQSPRDLAACAQLLARFHRAGRRIGTDKKGALQAVGTWPKLFRTRTELLAAYTKRAMHNECTPSLNTLLRRHGDQLLERCDEAEQRLLESDYAALCKCYGPHVTLCHGDSGPRNFVLTDQGAALIDFETLRHDLRVYDLYRMIRLACRNHGWPFAAARAVLDGYQTVSKLDLGEIELLSLWFLFPHKPARILAQYERADASRRGALVGKLEKTLDDEASLPTFLQDLYDYAEGRGAR
ncbi:MAG: phosphotransferase [Tumebacillaceae bacterium]